MCQYDGTLQKSSKKRYLQVYEEIRSYIKNNHLQPGDRLPTEAEMCRMYGVSRNVLREAIKSLEITGTITSKPGVGITIQRNSTDLFLSSFVSQINESNDETVQTSVEEARRILEIGLDYKAYSSVTDEQIAVMEEQLSIMRHRLENEEECLGMSFAAADAKFHMTLFQNCNNVLVLALNDLFWAYDRYFQGKMTPPAMNNTVTKHEMILGAIKSRNYPAFHEAMVYHYVHKYEKP